MQVFRLWICRCVDGRYWSEQPRHMTCVDCGALIREVDAVTVNDALTYSPETLRQARSY